ncbi:hypothetical protein ILUMI_08737 [Ignelater luminosus]|uniref:Renin receptor n=1 Tax=Ignelater luminosus TaxID=2038154 RepID=A0A8K0D5K8_IGNLU|nr:hypothetical protein ILUMI_08737 [Ignelater luminosus]
MLNILICITFYFAAVYGSGELTILHRPSSILFKGHDRLDESDLKEVYSAALGFSIEHSSTWPGMYLTDPFHLAEAIVTISIDGITDLGGGKGHHYPLRTDADDGETFYAMKKRIEERYPDGNSKIIDIDLSDGLNAIKDYEFLHDIKHIKKVKGVYSYLKTNVDEDHKFLQEINFLNAIIDKIESGVVKKDHKPDYYRIKCTSLHAVSDLHGENSTASKEAKQLLIETINRLNDAFNKAYGGSVLVSVVSSDVSHTRRVRSTNTQNESKATKEERKLPNINLAVTYNGNYPVIFNIILWFGVAMVFALLAISIVIGTMDPGRDSIIYRMTSTRLKKD